MKSHTREVLHREREGGASHRIKDPTRQIQALSMDPSHPPACMDPTRPPARPWKPAARATVDPGHTHAIRGQRRWTAIVVAQGENVEERGTRGGGESGDRELRRKFGRRIWESGEVGRRCRRVEIGERERAR